MRTKIERVKKVNLPDPKFGDMVLKVFPFTNTGETIKLPEGFQMWEDSLNEILKQIPINEVMSFNEHFVTIHSQFFSTGDFLRREGIHADGNFCVDPNFGSPTWGGTIPTWGGTKFDPVLKKIEKDWESPYDYEIPVGDYISYDKGGIFCVSTEVGCQGWGGEFFGEVGAEGNFESMKEQLTDDRKVIFEENTLYFMTSNTPHETLYIDKGKRRTFMRITLNHQYPNKTLPCMQNVKKEVLN